MAEQPLSFENDLSSAEGWPQIPLLVSITPLCTTTDPSKLDISWQDPASRTDFSIFCEGDMVVSPYTGQHQDRSSSFGSFYQDLGARMQPQDLRLSTLQNVDPNCDELLMQKACSMPAQPLPKLAGRSLFSSSVTRVHPYSNAKNRYSKTTAVQSNFNKSSTGDGSKKKMTPDSSCSSDTQHQRLAANDRERQRTQLLNMHFADLRRKVPSLPSDKLSKIQTLKLAMRYIQFLKDALNNGLVLTSGDIPDSWPTSSYLTHDLLSREFLFRRMQKDWAAQRQMS